MKILKTRVAVSNHSNEVKSQGKKLSFVPTMGALHQGHISLVTLAKKNSDHVIASIYVNPTQFGPNEDFDSYPRDIQNDLDLLEKAGCNAVFIPDEKEIYPEGKPESKNIVKENADILCGKSRPQFFHGIWLVVSRFFEIVQPDMALFGEKDFQQLQIIRNMAEEEGFNIEIIGAPIIREADGLAMSSRNKYLTEEERKIAPKLYEELKHIAEKILHRESVEHAISEAKGKLTNVGFDVDYLELRDSESLKLLNEYNPKARLFAAAMLGKTRLIDNIPI